ncbi:MAG: hypothetical protein R3F30_14655 [Planctomycetota bacterium]
MKEGGRHPDRMEHWFLGLRRIERRRFVDDERRVLNERLRDLRRELRLVLVVLVVTLVALSVLGVVAEDQQDLGFLVELCLVLVMLTLPLGLLRLRDSLREIRSLRLDLERGYVERFGGLLDPGRFLTGLAKRAHERLRSEEGFDADGEHSVEVLPTSGRVLSADGRPLSAETVASVGRAAAPPADPFVQPLPDGFRVVLKDPSLRVARRRLEEEEVHELEHWVHRYKQPGWTGIGAALLLCLLVVLARDGALDWSRFELPILAAIAIFGMVEYGRRWLDGSRLAEDHAQGWVLTIHDPAGEDEGMARLPLSRPRLEVLPMSRGVWTEGGRPAPWRLRDED